MSYDRDWEYEKVQRCKMILRFRVRVLTAYLITDLKSKVRVRVRVEQTRDVREHLPNDTIGVVLPLTPYQSPSEHGS